MLLPKIAYLTMCLSPDHWHRRITNMAWQEYSNELKVHMLLHQRSKKSGEFPIPIVHDYEHLIVERYLEGDWPALWGIKLWTGIELAAELECKYILIIDEDDDFHHLWTKKLVEFMQSGYNLAWTWINRDHKRGEIKVQRYDAPSGAMIVDTQLALMAVKDFKAKYPLGRRHDHATGALDLTFCKMLAAMPECKLLEFTEKDVEPRAYYRHGHANTTKRLYSDDIDFDFDYYQIREKQNVKVDNTKPKTFIGGKVKSVKSKKVSIGGQIRRRRKL